MGPPMGNTHLSLSCLKFDPFLNLLSYKFWATEIQFCNRICSNGIQYWCGGHQCCVSFYIFSFFSCKFLLAYLFVCFYLVFLILRLFWISFSFFYLGFSYATWQSISHLGGTKTFFFIIVVSYISIFHSLQQWLFWYKSIVKYINFYN